MTYPTLARLLTPPGPAEDIETVVDRWGAALADLLLRRTVLVAGGLPHRLREVELYLRAPHHPDPFAHAHPVQQRVAGWYFHRAGDSYRGGTFKGLDLSCGAPGVYGGVLLRSVEPVGGALVDGSCNTVDHLLRLTGYTTVAALDAAIAGRAADDVTSPLHLAPADGIDDGTDVIHHTPRVGLTLKRAASHPDMPRYLGRRLRFLTRPGVIRKGRVQTITALHADGSSVDAITALTGSPRSAVARAVAAYDQGYTAGDLAPFIGRATTTAELCHLLGAWDRCYSPSSNVDR